MLQKAQEKEIYDELIESELTAFFQQNDQRYDIIVCADTLVYFGSLTDVLKGMRSALTDEGTLAFTVEKLENGTDYTLSHTGRYQHAQKYLTRQLEQAEFQTPTLREVILRTERFRPVTGWLVVAHPKV